MDTKINEALRQAIKNMKIRFPGKVLAEKTGYATSTISEYINDKATPTEDFMQKFANEFGIRFDMAFANLFDEGRKEQNPLLEQVLEQEAINGDTALDVLIRANADQSMAVKDIAAANKELVLMLKEDRAKQPTESGHPTVSDEERILINEVPKLDKLLAGAIALLAQQLNQSYEEVEAKAHIAGDAILKSYKSGTLV